MPEVIDEYVTCSRNDLADFSYVWRINDVNLFMDSIEIEAIVSSAFSTGEIKMCLNLKKTYDQLELYLVYPEWTSPNLMNLELKIVDSSANLIEYETKQEMFLSSNWEKNCLAKFDIEECPLSEDLIIIFKWQYWKFDNSQSCKYQLRNHMAQKFENYQFYDIKFSVSGKEFHAHKLILAAQSSVFQKMFEDATDENIIVINDVIPAVFEEILRFVYTDKVPLENVSFELLDAANNFGLMRLKAICAKQLCSKLSIENVCDVLVQASKYKVVDLEKKCINFINVYADEVMKTDLIINASSNLSNICKSILLEHEFWKEIDESVLNKLPNFFVDSYFANSYVNTTKFKYKWTIKNFSSYTEIEKFLSPTFCKGAHMRISIDDDDVNLDLIHEAETIVTQCKFVILNEDDDKNFEKSCQFKGCDGGIEEFIDTDFLLDQTNGFISNDTVTIICQGRVLFDCQPFTTHQLLSSEFKIPNCDLGSDLWRLLKNSKFSDVILNVSGIEFHAHKWLLSVRSPVFQAMFQHDMEESRLNKVDITDIELEVFEEMLNYIYTGRVSNIDEISTELLCAADKYALEELKIICQKKLSDNLSSDSAFETLIFAKTHNLKELKASVISFFKENAEIMTSGSEWESMMKTNPSLIIEICETAIEKKILQEDAF